MRALTTAVALLAGLSACGWVPSPPGGPAPAPETGELVARLVGAGTGPDLAFEVSRPAYVAIFEVAPGRGASLVYPGFAPRRQDGYVTVGSHWVPSMGVDRRPYQMVSSVVAASSPVFYLLVASTRPLDLERIGPHGWALQTAMSAAYGTLSPVPAFERLVELTVRVPEVGGWTTDLYVHWPQVVSPRLTPGRVLVTCNGYRLYTSPSQVLRVRDHLCNLGSVEEPGTPPVDSTGAEVERPQRRPPAPEGDEAHQRRRLIASSQLSDAVEAESRPTPARARASIPSGRLSGDVRREDRDARGGLEEPPPRSRDTASRSGGGSSQPPTASAPPSRREPEAAPAPAAPRGRVSEGRPADTTHRQPDRDDP